VPEYEHAWAEPAKTASASSAVVDFVPAAIRERFIDGISVRTLAGLVAPVYALDGALAPIGLLVAFAGTRAGAAMALLAVPLAIVLAVLSRERQARVDQALELRSAYRGTAMLLGDVVEADDAYTGSHSRGVVDLSLAVSDRLGLDHRQRRNVEFAALLHDVGKIAVPKEIINKAGPLDSEEWQVMYRHTVHGEEMLNRVGASFPRLGASSALRTSISTAAAIPTAWRGRTFRSRPGSLPAAMPSAP
jgi:hypothetical protein